MRLQQHLGDARRGTEVAVDLERPVVEEVVERVLPEQVIDLLAGGIAFAQAGEQIDLVRAVPSMSLTAVCAVRVSTVTFAAAK